MASSLSLLSPCSNAASIGLHSSAHDAFSSYPYLVSTTGLRRRQLPQILSSTLAHGRHWKALAGDTRVHGEGIDIERGQEKNGQSSSSSSSRRHALLAGGLLPALRFVFPAVGDATVSPAKIDLTTAPTHPFDAADGRLREAASVFQRALSAPTVEEEEELWTEVIDKYGKLDAEWVPDIVSRAWGNRGNSRSRQGKMEEALEDFDRSIELAPYAVDPVLNRGVTLESLGRYDEAAADYQAVLAAQPNDPAAWNNLGNVKAALRQWDEALVNYRQAVQLAPEFSFAAANYALALYQVGKENEAFKQFRSLLRKYPEFPDVRAALAVALYAQGLTAEAETNWGRMQDGRYRDREWVRNTRKWPPKLVNALEGFLDIKAVARS